MYFLYKIFFIMLFWGALSFKPALSDNMLINFIDIGPGDSCFITMSDGNNILIDAGNYNSNKLISFLRTKKLTKIDNVIVTQPDIEHYGGLLKLSKLYKIEKFFETGVPTSGKKYLALLRSLKKQKSKIKLLRAGELIKLNDKTFIDVIHPDNNLLNNQDIDENSLVFKLKHDNLTFLFTGDINEKAQQHLLKYYKTKLKSDVIKIPSHGNFNQRTSEFLNAVMPEYAVITSNYPSFYNLPDSRLIDVLKIKNIQTFHTASHGNINISSDGHKLDFDYDKNNLRVSEKKSIVINQSSVEDLELLSGMNALLSAKIISKRPFKNWQQLEQLGIKQKEIKQIKQISLLQLPIEKTTGNPSEKRQLININTASLEKLISLPGVGPKTAEKIIKGRPYNSKSTILKVKGIGPKKYSKLTNLITVN